MYVKLNVSGQTFLKSKHTYVKIRSTNLTPMYINVKLHYTYHFHTHAMEVLGGRGDIAPTHSRPQH
jgi:hypothetical protein